MRFSESRGSRAADEREGGVGARQGQRSIGISTAVHRKPFAMAY